MGTLKDSFGKTSHVYDLAMEIMQKTDEKSRFKKTTDKNSIYTEWTEYFADMYDLPRLGTELFFQHTYFIAILKVFVIVKVLPMKRELTREVFQKNWGNWIAIERHIKEQLPSDLFQDAKLPMYDEFLLPMFDALQKVKEFEPDIFAELYQDLFGHTSRHDQGEYFTHYFLASEMVDFAYEFGERALDPTCGTGTFLVALVLQILEAPVTFLEKLHAIQQIAGIDINPLAVSATKTNLLFHLSQFIDQNLEKMCQKEKNTKLDPHKQKQELLASHFPQILLKDALFIERGGLLEYIDKKTMLAKEFDLIIGNPPWVVLNGISSKDYKRQVKELGQQLGIVRGSHYATSTELCTLFYYQFQEFLREGGRTFFVAPASLLTGAQHALFRQFHGFSKIQVWAFNNDLFPIHSICLHATKGDSPKSGHKIRQTTFDSKDRKHLEAIDEQLLIPIKITSKKGRKLVGRFIPEEEHNFILPQRDSVYEPLFRQGASLVPRILLFVDILKEIQGKNSNLVQITPSKKVKAKKYSRWDYTPFEKALVEKSHIYRAIKSTCLIPFAILDPYDLFLPLQDSEGQLQFGLTAEKSKKHYKTLEESFEEHKKKSTRIKTLWDRINYGSALVRPDQSAANKIVFAGIGTIVKAALTKKPYIIDTSLYYYVPDSEEEAYYLLGYLNSPILSEHVRMVGSTGHSGSLRNIHKHPLKFGLPSFDGENPSHIELSKLARQAETYVTNFVDEHAHLSRLTLQNALFRDKTYLTMLNKLSDVLRELHKVQNAQKQSIKCD